MEAHAKSFSLGQLALHVATIPGFLTDMVLPAVLELPKWANPTGDKSDGESRLCV